MTDEELAAIKTRADAATPGPWHEEPGAISASAGVLFSWMSHDSPWWEGYEDSPQADTDAAFIAHAREDVPALLAEVERLRAELARLRPEPVQEPAPELYRIIWWQSLIQGMTDGQTLEENVTREQVPARIAYHRIGLAGAIGVMIDAAPMSFVPGGDKKDE